MAVKVKDGVVIKEFTKYIFEMIKILFVLSDEFQKDMIITSVYDGVHKPNSLHYKGKAIDIRTTHLTKEEKEKVLKRLKELLGNDYQVIFETSPEHIHIEYDPKREV